MNIFSVTFAACVFAIISPRVTVAQEALCGAAPALSSIGESADSVKGELQGQADFLSKLVGKAELAGQIEAARRTIYQNSDKFFAAQKDAYLAYVFCELIFQDRTLSTSEKLKALQEYKSADVSK